MRLSRTLEGRLQVLLLHGLHVVPKMWGMHAGLMVSCT